MPTLVGADVNDAAKRLMDGIAEPTEPTAEANEQPSRDTDTPEGDTETNERRRKFKLDDREIEIEILSDDIDLDLVPKGLMMEADYRKKTAETSEQRKAWSGKLQELDASLSEAKTLIEFDLDALESNETLKEEDPEEYLHQLDSIKGRIEKYKAHKSKLDTAREEERAAKMDKEGEKLRTAIPDWLDETARQKDVERIVKAWQGVGFSQEEIGEKLDHRDVVLARKAALYDELMSQNLDEKLDRKPLKSAKPSSNEKRIDEGLNDARKKLKETGNWRDAAKLFTR